MNGLAALLEQFSLPELTKVLRRTVLWSIALATVVFIVSVVLSQTDFGFGLVIGFALGLANIRLVTMQTAKVSDKKIAKPVRALASLTLLRLGATTAVIILLAILVTSLGIGAVAGIALFYLVFLANLIASVFKHRGVPT